MLPFGRMRGRGTFPANNERRTITVAGVDPRARGTVRLVDRFWGRGLDGRSGHIAAGEGSDPSYRFAGYMNYQLLAKVSPTGQSTNLRGSPNVALPATSGEVVSVQPGQTVADSLAMIPPGVR